MRELSTSGAVGGGGRVSKSREDKMNTYLCTGWRSVGGGEDLRVLKNRRLTEILVKFLIELVHISMSAWNTPDARLHVWFFYF